MNKEKENEEDINKTQKSEFSKKFFNENKLKDQLQSLQGYVTDLSEENDLLVETIEELENDSNSRMIDFNKKFSELCAHIEKLEKEVEDLNFHNDELQSDVDVFVNLFRDKSIDHSQLSHLVFKSFPANRLFDDCKVQTSNDGTINSENCVSKTTVPNGDIKENGQENSHTVEDQTLISFENKSAILKNDALINQLQKEINEYEKEKQALTDKIFRQDQLMLDLHDKIHMGQKIDELRVLELQNNISSIATLERNNEAQNEKILQLQKSVSDVTTQLENERKIMALEVANQHDVASKLRQELSECKKKFDDSVKQVRLQGEIIINLRKNVKEIEQQNTDYKSKLLALETILEEKSLEKNAELMGDHPQEQLLKFLKKEDSQKQSSSESLNEDEQKQSSAENIENLLKHQVKHIDELEKYITELEEKLHNSEKAQIEYENTNADLKSNNKNIINQLEELEDQFQEMKLKLDSAEQIKEQEIHKNSLNEDKIIGLYDEINHLHKNLENLNAELKTKNVIIDQATSESLVYKQKYAEKDLELQNQLVVIKQLEVNYAKISSELLELKTNACDEILLKEQKISCLAEELEIANLRYSNISDELNSLETELDKKNKSVDFSDDINLMKTQLEVAQEDIHQLEMGLTLITEKHEALLKENVIKESSVLNLQSELDVTHQEFEYVIDDIDKKSEEIEKLTLIIDHLQKSCLNLETEKEFLTNQAVMHEKLVEKLQGKIQLLEEKCINSNECLEKQKTNLEKSCHDISSLNQKLAKQSDYIMSLENLLLQLKKEGGESRLKNIRLEDAIKEKSESLEVTVQECAHYKNLYSQLSSDYKALQEVQEKTQTAFNNLQNKNNQYFEELSCLKNDANDVAEQIYILQNCVHDLINKYCSSCESENSISKNYPLGSPLGKKVRKTIDQFGFLDKILHDYLAENKNLAEKLSECSNKLAVKEMHLSQKINELAEKLEELCKSEHALEESHDKYKVVLDEKNVLLLKTLNQENEIKTLEAQLLKMRQQYQDTSHKLAHFEEKSATIERNQLATQNQLNNQITEAAAIEKALKKAQFDLKCLVDEDKNKGFQIEKLICKIEAKDKEIMVFKNKVEDLSNENQSYQDILIRYEKQLNDAQNHIEQLSIQLEQKCRLILTAQESILKLQKRAERSKKEVSNPDLYSNNLELNKLTDLHKDLVDKYEEQKSSNNQLHEELNSCLTQHQALLEEIASKDAELRVLKTEWNATKNKCQRYENDLKLSKELEEKLVKENQELQNSFSKVQHNLLLQGNKRKKLENYLKKTLDKLSASENEVCRLSFCVEDLKKEIVQAAEQQKQYTLQISELEENIIMLKNKVKNTEEELVMQEEEMELAKSHNSKLNHEKNQLHAELHEVQKELEDIRKNRIIYQKENHNNPLRTKEEMSLYEELNYFKRENSDLKNHIDECRAEKELLFRSYINEQEETILQLRSEVRELKTALIAERNNRSHTIDDLQKRIKMHLETIQQLHKQLSELGAENFRQKELLDWQAYSRKNLHEQLKTQEKDLSSLRENLNKSFEEIMVTSQRQ